MHTMLPMDLCFISHLEDLVALVCNQMAARRFRSAFSILNALYFGWFVFSSFFSASSHIMWKCYILRIKSILFRHPMTINFICSLKSNVLNMRHWWPSKWAFQTICRLFLLKFSFEIGSVQTSVTHWCLFVALPFKFFALYLLVLWHLSGLS